ncbi:GRIM-19, partial [Paraphysoderma sedebokerense]
PVQDLPPPGGFGSVRYKRNLPSRGPSGAVLFAGVIGIMTYGWYWTIEGIKERRELKREKVWSRIHLTPVLQAESDREEVRRILHQEQTEAEVMKDVKGWKVGESVYHTKRYVPPTVMV